jgi:MFS family permease
MSSSGKARSLAVLAVCEVCGMSLWFSASAVLPTLKAQYAVSGMQAAALSSSVALGFVVGTLLSAILGLADRIESRRFFTASAVVGALATGATIFVDPTSFLFVALRFIVGASIAGIYPVGIKMAASWAAGDLGFCWSPCWSLLLLSATARHFCWPPLAMSIGGTRRSALARWRCWALC